jgi:hypothetical protein
MNNGVFIRSTSSNSSRLGFTKSFANWFANNHDSLVATCADLQVPAAHIKRSSSYKGFVAQFDSFFKFDSVTLLGLLAVVASANRHKAARQLHQERAANAIDALWQAACDATADLEWTLADDLVIRIVGHQTLEASLDDFLSRTKLMTKCCPQRLPTRRRLRLKILCSFTLCLPAQWSDATANPSVLAKGKTAVLVTISYSYRVCVVLCLRWKRAAFLPAAVADRQAPPTIGHLWLFTIRYLQGTPRIPLRMTHLIAQTLEVALPAKLKGGLPHEGVSRLPKTCVRKAIYSRFFNARSGFVKQVPKPTEEQSETEKSSLEP